MTAEQRTDQPRQDPAAAELNADFFEGEKHGELADQIDTYRRIREAITREVAGTEQLLDVGNGGVFEYDTDSVESIVAVDLFLDRLPASAFPDNVIPRQGDALELTEPDDSFDVVLHAMLYHHLVGERPEELIANVRRAIAGAVRVLRPGGRLVVVEPTVPRWFYGLERLLQPLLKLAARTPLLGGHPPTLPMTSSIVAELVGDQLQVESSYRIPRGRWSSLFGRRVPAAIVPSHPHMVTARKPLTG